MSTTWTWTKNGLGDLTALAQIEVDGRERSARLRVTAYRNSDGYGFSYVGRIDNKAVAGNLDRERCVQATEAAAAAMSDRR